MSEGPLELTADTGHQYLYLFANGQGFYVTARVALQGDLIGPGLANSHQCIELLIKAIVVRNEVPAKGHNLVGLLKKYEGRSPYFHAVLEDSEIVGLLNALSHGYLTHRYAEGGVIVDPPRVIQRLDELAHSLRNVYLDTLVGVGRRLYVPRELRDIFLRDNRFFSRDDLVANAIASLFGFDYFDQGDDVRPRR